LTLTCVKKYGVTRFLFGLKTMDWEDHREIYNIAAMFYLIEA
jgi:hypothetical protein